MGWVSILHAGILARWFDVFCFCLFLLLLFVWELLFFVFVVVFCCLLFFFRVFCVRHVTMVVSEILFGVMQPKQPTYRCARHDASDYV